MKRFLNPSVLIFTLLRKILFLWVRSEIKGVEDEELDELVKAVFGRVSRWEGGPQPVRFNLDYRHTFVEAFEG